jgi:hypothetical protein
MTDTAAEVMYFRVAMFAIAASFWVPMLTAKFALTAMLAFVASVAHRWITVRIDAWRLTSRQIAKLVVEDGEFVKRKSREDAFLYKLMESLGYETTVLVYGQRGSGKTSFIRSALRGRKGVITIRIGEKTHDEAEREFIEKLSTTMHFFGKQQNRRFVEDVFKSCRVRPVVVVSIAAKCSGEVLEAVLVQCKRL